MLATGAAQTVTGSGTSGVVPVFSGASSVTNSPVTVSGGNVGIGTTSPQELFHLSGSTGIVAGTTNNAAYGSSNAVIQSSYGARIAGTGSALSFAFPADTDGSNLFEQARIVGTPDNATNGNAQGRMYLQTRTLVGGAWVWNSNLLLASDGSVTLGGNLKFSDGTTQATAANLGAISTPINVTAESGASQVNIAEFVNGTNSAYTSITGAGSASTVPSWSNGSQILEFVPYGTGNGIVGSYTGSLLFQTNYRTNQMAILTNGNVGIGTTSPGAKLEVDGNVKLTSGSGASMIFQDGSVQTVAWNGVLSGGDYAESVDVRGERSQYEPGDVLVIDHDSEKMFLRSSEPYSTAVMGIYSTRPGVVGRRQLSDRSHMKEEVPMAMIGVVPTKVCEEGGPIRPGDLLVTSSRPGYAMKGTDRTRLIGAIIGKALERLDKETGMIEVAVSLQ